MSIVKFEKPELDEQLVTALEQLDEAEKLLKYYMGIRGTITAVRSALGRNAKPHLLEMLDEQVDRLSRDVDTAEMLVANWKEILENLQSRAARP